MTPSSASVLSGMGGSCLSSLLERSVGLLPWFGNTIFGETVRGTSNVSCADVGIFTCFLYHLNELSVRRWGLWIRSRILQVLLSLHFVSVGTDPTIGSPLGFLPGESDSPPLD